MNQYDASRPCSKCGASGSTDKWRDASHINGYPVAPERIVRTCTNCGYEWAEKPLHTLEPT